MIQNILYLQNLASLHPVSLQSYYQSLGLDDLKASLVTKKLWILLFSNSPNNFTFYSKTNYFFTLPADVISFFVSNKLVIWFLLFDFKSLIFLFLQNSNFSVMPASRDDQKYISEQYEVCRKIAMADPTELNRLRAMITQFRVSELTVSLRIICILREIISTKILYKLNLI